MATASQMSLPPLPDKTSSTVPASTNGDPASGLSGLSPVMDAIRSIESGYQQLAQVMPSLAPVAAEAISKLRVAVPSALSAGAGSAPAGQGQGMPPPQPVDASNPPAITGSSYLPPPQQG